MRTRWIDIHPDELCVHNDFEYNRLTVLVIYIERSYVKPQGVQVEGAPVHGTHVKRQASSYSS